MATYFVFENSPSVNNLLNYIGKDEITDKFITIEDAEVNYGHYNLTINGHHVGVQIEGSGIITAIYVVEEDYEGVRLLTILIKQWSKENSIDEDDIATIVKDDEMSAYLGSV